MESLVNGSLSGDRVWKIHKTIEIDFGNSAGQLFAFDKIKCVDRG
jgi:hypothetical protein